MKVLNLIERVAKERAADSEKTMTLNINYVFTIADAFRALEQRAEAAEAKIKSYSADLVLSVEEINKLQAKLAELEKQEPVGHFMLARDEDDSWWHEASEQNDKAIPLFTRPAPAINLAELVFPVDGLPDNAEESQDYRTGFAMGCACYAKRIVELNPHLVRNIGEEK